MNELSNKKRNISWAFQSARGLAIIAVLFIHCESVKQLSGYIVVRNFLSFPVALFFFIAGYFLPVGGCDINWVKKRVFRLAVPYLLFSCLFFVVFGTKGIINWVYALLLGKAATPLYYIVVLLYFTLLTPIMKKYSKGLCLLTPLMMMLAYVITACGIDVWRNFKITPIWIGFYLGGVQLRRKRVCLSEKKLLILAALAVLGSIMESALWQNVNNMRSVAFGQYRLTSFIYATMLCLIVYMESKKESEYWNGALAKLGNISYTVFYTHYFFVVAYSRLEWFRESVLIRSIGEIVFVYGGGILSAVLLKKLVKNQKLRIALALD